MLVSVNVFWVNVNFHENNRKYQLWKFCTEIDVNKLVFLESCLNIFKMSLLTLCTINNNKAAIQFLKNILSLNVEWK